MSVQIADSNQIEVMGLIDVDFQIAGHSFHTHLAILPKVSTPLILGNDFLNKYSAILNFSKEPSLTLSIPQKLINFLPRIEIESKEPIPSGLNFETAKTLPCTKMKIKTITKENLKSGTETHILNSVSDSKLNELHQYGFLNQIRLKTSQVLLWGFFMIFAFLLVTMVVSSVIPPILVDAHAASCDLYFKQDTQLVFLGPIDIEIGLVPNATIFHRKQIMELRDKQIFMKGVMFLYLL